MLASNWESIIVAFCGRRSSARHFENISNDSYQTYWGKTRELDGPPVLSNCLYDGSVVTITRLHSCAVALIVRHHSILANLFLIISGRSIP